VIARRDADYLAGQRRYLYAKNGPSAAELVEVAQRLTDADVFDGTCEACGAEEAVSLSWMVTDRAAGGTRNWRGRWLITGDCTRETEHTWIWLRDFQTVRGRGRAVAHFGRKLGFDYMDFVHAVARLARHAGLSSEPGAVEGDDDYGHVEGRALDRAVTKILAAVRE
jgi:hypothetical protein